MSAQIPLQFKPADPVSIEVISRLPDMTAAIKLCVQVSGRLDKSIYMDLDIDAATWSRINSNAPNAANFPQNKLESLFDACGNEIPLQWLAWRRGKGLHLLESESQRLMREKDSEIAELKKQLAWTAALVQGK